MKVVPHASTLAWCILKFVEIANLGKSAICGIWGSVENVNLRAKTGNCSQISIFHFCDFVNLGKSASWGIRESGVKKETLMYFREFVGRTARCWGDSYHFGRF